jgi:cell division initiation protein
MRITPVDIRQQQFTTRFRGFDQQEVDTFLEDVADDYENLLKENGLLKEQLAVHEERSRGMVEHEKLLKDTLVTTQRIAEEMKENCRREAQVAVREAEVQAEKLLEAARTAEAKIRTEIWNLKKTRRQLMETLMSTVETYQRIVAGDLQDAAAADDGKPE